MKRLERLLHRVAYNIGNTPSTTDVKILSCIPMDVSDLQDRIECLEKELGVARNLIKEMDAIQAAKANQKLAKCTCGNTNKHVKVVGVPAKEPVQTDLPKTKVSISSKLENLTAPNQTCNLNDASFIVGSPLSRPRADLTAPLEPTTTHDKLQKTELGSTSECGKLLRSQICDCSPDVFVTNVDQPARGDVSCGTDFPRNVSRDTFDVEKLNYLDALARSGQSVTSPRKENNNSNVLYSNWYNTRNSCFSFNNTNKTLSVIYASNSSHYNQDTQQYKDTMYDVMPLKQISQQNKSNDNILEDPAFNDYIPTRESSVVRRNNIIDEIIRPSGISKPNNVDKNFNVDPEDIYMKNIFDNDSAFMYGTDNTISNILKNRRRSDRTVCEIKTILQTFIKEMRTNELHYSSLKYGTKNNHANNLFQQNNHLNNIKSKPIGNTVTVGNCYSLYNNQNGQSFFPCYISCKGQGANNKSKDTQTEQCGVYSSIDRSSKEKPQMYNVTSVECMQNKCRKCNKYKSGPQTKTVNCESHYKKKHKNRKVHDATPDGKAKKSHDLKEKKKKVKRLNPKKPKEIETENVVCAKCERQIHEGRVKKRQVIEYDGNDVIKCQGDNAEKLESKRKNIVDNDLMFDDHDGMGTDSCFCSADEDEAPCLYQSYEGEALEEEEGDEFESNNTIAKKKKPGLLKKIISKIKKKKSSKVESTDEVVRPDELDCPGEVDSCEETRFHKEVLGRKKPITAYYVTQVPKGPFRYIKKNKAPICVKEVLVRNTSTQIEVETPPIQQSPKRFSGHAKMKRDYCEEEPDTGEAETERSDVCVSRPKKKKIVSVLKNKEYEKYLNSNIECGCRETFATRCKVFPSKLFTNRNKKCPESKHRQFETPRNVCKSEPLCRAWHSQKQPDKCNKNQTKYSTRSFTNKFLTNKNKISTENEKRQFEIPRFDCMPDPYTLCQPWDVQKQLAKYDKKQRKKLARKLMMPSNIIMRRAMMNAVGKPISLSPFEHVSKPWMF